MGRQAWVWVLVVVVDGDCPPALGGERGQDPWSLWGSKHTHQPDTHSVYGPVEVRTGESERGPQRDVEMKF